MSWTDERIERLRAMWTKGATASQIAEELGGVSRNAVIGKAHRLGLESRPSPVKAGEEKQKKIKTPSIPKVGKPVSAKPAPSAAVPGGSAPETPRTETSPPVQQQQRRSSDPNAIQYRSVGPGG